MRTFIALCTLAVAALSVHALTTSVKAQPSDGQHDFDFEVGHWNIHLKRRLHPLTGSNQWVEFDGTSVTRFLWHGAAQIEQFETDGAGGHIEGLTLRTFNPTTHQWRLYWANSSNGIVVVPQIGQFANGQGEFYAQDTLNGKSIFIRFIWSKTNTNTPHFEQAFSGDGGKTWEVNWITDQTRVADTTEKPIANAPATQHDFDFIFGQWKYHLKRLTADNQWVELDGNLTGHRLWDGRANLGETEAQGPNSRLMGLTLRTYNPRTHQWYLYWANSRDGILSIPQIGEFKNGVGEFYAQDDDLSNRGLLIRYVWSATTTNDPHFEQAFSSDGGRTWEVNWITDQSRVGQ
jgi:hypothetical protein